MATKLHKLGRLVNHDPRSRGFASVVMPRPLVTTIWLRQGPIFDQGDLGSCTCESMCGILNTRPFQRNGVLYTQSDCVDLYSAATRLDKIAGEYPPDDTGSSGLAAAKAAHKRGWLRGYHHAFTLPQALSSLTRGPGMTGINWYDSFDAPGSNGELVISPNASIRGGHELEVSEIHVETRMIRGPNSWGDGWGNRGFWSMSWSTFDRLLSEQGDYTIPVL